MYVGTNCCSYIRSNLHWLKFKVWLFFTKIQQDMNANSRNKAGTVFWSSRRDGSSLHLPAEGDVTPVEGPQPKVTD